MKEEKKREKKIQYNEKKNKEWCWATNGARLHSLTNVADFSRHFTAGKFQKTPFFNRETKCLGLNIESLETVNEWCSACTRILFFSNFLETLKDPPFRDQLTEGFHKETTFFESISLLNVNLMDLVLMDDQIRERLFANRIYLNVMYVSRLLNRQS